MYVCMNVWMYVCMYACIHVCMDVQTDLLRVSRGLPCQKLSQRNTSRNCRHVFWTLVWAHTLKNLPIETCIHLHQVSSFIKCKNMCSSGVPLQSRIFSLWTHIWGMTIPYKACLDHGTFACWINRWKELTGLTLPLYEQSHLQLRKSPGSTVCFPLKASHGTWTKCKICSLLCYDEHFETGC